MHNVNERDLYRICRGGNLAELKYHLTTITHTVAALNRAAVITSRLGHLTSTKLLVSTEITEPDLPAYIAAATDGGHDATIGYLRNLINKEERSSNE